jgi:glycerophosphoryl diester phosphodiesterase
MIVISHRGYWLTPDEKNQMTAFERSFREGFGVELDIRDYRGDLVISHDVADSGSARLDFFFEMYNKNNKNLTLALNIKSDGLQVKLKSMLDCYHIENYFVFDMSIPDMLQYRNHGMCVFSRVSEYEKLSESINGINGIWLDQFESNWFNDTLIDKILEKQKNICIVSSELHKRKNIDCWNMLKKIPNNKIMLCTDYPSEAEVFFNG